MGAIPDEGLNEPAFDIKTPDSQKIDDSGIPEPRQEESRPAKRIEEGAAPTRDGVSRETEEGGSPRFQRRFDKVYGERMFYEREAQAAKARAEAAERLLEQSMRGRTEPASDDKFNRWKKVLGDTPVTKEFYDLLNGEMSAYEQRAAEKAIETFRETQQAAAERTKAAESAIDADMDELQDSLGRDLTDDEATEILNVADEMTPKDAEGNYKRPLVPLTAAYEVYMARQKIDTGARREARNRANQAIGSGRGGIDDSPPTIQRGRPNPDGWRKAIFGN